MSILVTGSIALDTVTTPFGNITEGLGGSATHFAVSASYYTDVHVIAVVGDDFPEDHLQFLKSKGVDIEGIEKVKGKTFRWTGKYDYNLNNAQTLNTELNVFETFSPKIPEGYQNIDYLFLANIDPDLQRTVIEKVGASLAAPRVVACDTMNFWIEGKREALVKTIGLVDMLTINEGEARLLANEPNLVKAAKIIHAMGPKTIVIKQGEYGALLLHEDHIFSAPALPLETIKDPTGAGDSFAGGFMGFLSKSGDLSIHGLKQAVILGSVMASFNVEEFSCDRLRTLTQDDIRRRYREFKKLSHFDEIEF